MKPRSTPETKEQPKLWTHKSSSPPKKAKSVLSAEEVMATVLWDSHKIVLVDYLEEKETKFLR